MKVIIISHIVFPLLPCNSLLPPSHIFEDFFLVFAFSLYLNVIPSVVWILRLCFIVHIIIQHSILLVYSYFVNIQDTWFISLCSENSLLCVQKRMKYMITVIFWLLWFTQGVILSSVISFISLFTNFLFLASLCNM